MFICKNAPFMNTSIRDSMALQSGRNSSVQTPQPFSSRINISAHAPYQRYSRTSPADSIASDRRGRYSGRQYNSEPDSAEKLILFRITGTPATTVWRTSRNFNASPLTLPRVRHPSNFRDPGPDNAMPCLWSLTLAY